MPNYNQLSDQQPQNPNNAQPTQPTILNTSQPAGNQTPPPPIAPDSKSKKKKILLLLAGLLVLILAVTGAVIYRNVNQQAAVVVEQQEVMFPEEDQIDESIQPEDEVEAAPRTVRTGTFVDADAVHKGSGTARIVVQPDGSPLLVFDEDFSVTSGPDLLVYLSPNAPGEPLGEFASLGDLKSFNGRQVYNAPDNYQDYKTVVIWCRAFSVTFSAAELE